jgi:2-alkenal reductase
MSAAPTPTSVAAVVPDQFSIVAAEQAVLVELYERINPAVVAITVHYGRDSIGQGTGFVVDSEGHIVTNHHVVASGGEIEIAFFGGERMRAELLGGDATTDIAVLQSARPPVDVSPVVLADSELVQVGQRVVAIGSPFGLQGTLTSGIVSGLGRTLASGSFPGLAGNGSGGFSTPDVIQTDAAINPGNSGGPLINLDGEVIGMNKAIYSESGLNSGVGFAIAANTLRRLLPDLIEKGEYQHPYLGIRSRDTLSLDEIETLGLPQQGGVYVVCVDASGPAAAAGLRGGNSPQSCDGLEPGGDVIVAIDRRPVHGFADLLSYLVHHTRAGQIVKLTVLREGAKLEFRVTLAPRP